MLPRWQRSVSAKGGVVSSACSWINFYGQYQLWNQTPGKGLDSYLEFSRVKGAGCVWGYSQILD